MSAEAPSSVVKFLAGSGPDANGRYMDDVLALTDRDLELRHDYIQWLFPLDTQSLAVPSSPVLSPGDVAVIRASECCQENLRRAAVRMARFYRDNDFWLVPLDHNHKRITRIIKSLKILVGQQEAEDFYRVIMSRVIEAGDPVAKANQRYWRDAAGSG